MENLISHDVTHSTVIKTLLTFCHLYRIIIMPTNTAAKVGDILLQKQ